MSADQIMERAISLAAAANRAAKTHAHGELELLGFVRDAIFREMPDHQRQIDTLALTLTDCPEAQRLINWIWLDLVFADLLAGAETVQ